MAMIMTLGFGCRWWVITRSDVQQGTDQRLLVEVVYTPLVEDPPLHGFYRGEKSNDRCQDDSGMLESVGEDDSLLVSHSDSLVRCS